MLLIRQKGIEHDLSLILQQNPLHYAKNKDIIKDRKHHVRIILFFSII